MASRSWNRVELIGNLTRDPELRYTPNGAAVCTFGLATNRTYVSDGEKKEEVDFHRLVAWNKLAELCNQLLKKGNRTFISGRLQTRSWEAQDGQTRTVTEIVIEDMILLSPKTDFSSAPVSEDIDTALPVKEEKTEKKVEKVEDTENNRSIDVEEETIKEKTASKKEESAPAEPSPNEEVDEDLPF